MNPPPLSDARVASGLLFTSGQIARDSSGAIVAGGIEQQTEQVLANLTRVLNGYGASLGDVVKVTAWLTDAKDAAAFNAIYSRTFASPYPARSTVVSTLLPPGALVEIEAVAQRS